MQGKTTRINKEKMTPYQFTCLFVLAIACLSFALAQQEGNVAARHDEIRMTGHEVGVYAIRGSKIMGRKMVTMLNPMKGYHANGGISKKSKRTDEASFENDNKRGKKASHVGRKFKVDPLPDQEVDDRGFVVCSADYPAPRRHPPKHN